MHAVECRRHPFYFADIDIGKVFDFFKNVVHLENNSFAVDDAVDAGVTPSVTMSRGLSTSVLAHLEKWFRVAAGY